MRNSLKNGYGDPGKVTESLIDRYVALRCVRATGMAWWKDSSRHRRAK
jgi:hypothetical protein